MKFKNIKKKAKKAKYPSNSRSITVLQSRTSLDRPASKPAIFKFHFPKISHTTLVKAYGWVLKVFVVFIFIVAVIIVGIDFQKNLQERQSIDSQRAILTKDLNFWEDFISKNKNYRDAYFQASVLEYRLGDTSKAKAYVEKGLALDPNSINGLKLEKFLANK